MPPMSPPTTSHSPVCRPARRVRPSGATASTTARAQRTASEGGPANVTRKASPIVLTSRPPKRSSSRPDRRVVRGQEGAPARVAQPGRVPGRVDDVREEHRQQLARDAAAAPASQELLDLAQQRRAVADAHEVVVALELDQARAGHTLGDEPRVARVDDEVAAAVEHEGRDAQALEVVARVVPRDLPRVRRQGTRREGPALVAGDP